MIPFYNTSKWVLIALSQRFLKSAWQCTRALYIHCCGTMRYPSDRYFIDFPSKADGNVGAPTRNNGSNMCSLLGMLTKGHPQKIWQWQMNQPGWRIWEAVPNKELTSIRLVSPCTARTSLIRGWYLKPARNGQNLMEHVCFNVKH